MAILETVEVGNNLTQETITITARTTVAKLSAPLAFGNPRAAANREPLIVG
jgi:hypothetical protein